MLDISQRGADRLGPHRSDGGYQTVSNVLEKYQELSYQDDHVSGSSLGYVQGSASFMARVGSALEVKRLDDFSAEVSYKSFLLPELARDLCDLDEPTLKVRGLARGSLSCWDG